MILIIPEGLEHDSPRPIPLLHNLSRFCSNQPLGTHGRYRASKSNLNANLLPASEPLPPASENGQWNPVQKAVADADGERGRIPSDLLVTGPGREMCVASLRTASR